MTDDPQLESLARDLHAIRAEPDPEFARGLDRRTAEWLREGERSHRLPSLRIAVPALAAVAAAVVIALVVVGGDEAGDTGTLSVAVVPAGQEEAQGLSAPAPQRDSGAGAEAPGEQAERSFLTSPSPARAGEPLVATYAIPQAGRARVRFGDRETQVEVPAGDGRLEISTEGLDPGSYDLEIELPPVPAQRTRVEILPGG
jgi:hypothetical protein